MGLKKQEIEDMLDLMISQVSSGPWTFDKNQDEITNGRKKIVNVLVGDWIPDIDFICQAREFVPRIIESHESLVKALKTCVVALYAHPELSDRDREAIKEAEAVLGQLEGRE